MSNMNYCLDTIYRNFMKPCLFGMFKSDLERELYDESAPVMSRKMILMEFRTFLLGLSYLFCDQLWDALDWTSGCSVSIFWIFWQIICLLIIGDLTGLSFYLNFFASWNVAIKGNDTFSYLWVRWFTWLSSQEFALVACPLSTSCYFLAICR